MNSLEFAIKDKLDNCEGWEKKVCIALDQQNRENVKEVKK